MIPTQLDPNSPATQPYNQAPKAVMAMQQPVAQNNPFAGIDAFNTQPVSVQQRFQQPMQQQKATVDPSSPLPNYTAAAPTQTIMEGAQMAPTSPALGYGNNYAPITQANQSYAAPVTPPSQYGAGGFNQLAAPVNQSPPAVDPFAVANSVEGQPQPVTPTLQYNMPNGGNVVEQKPAAPPAAFTTNAPSFTSSIPASAEQNDDSFDFGPPMGSPVEGIKLSEMPESTAVVPTTTENRYENVVNGMGTLSIRPGQASPEEMPFGICSTGYPTQQQSQQSAAFPEQQIYATTMPATSWSAGVQQQQQPFANPNPTGWNQTTPQQQPTPYSGQGNGGTPHGYEAHFSNFDHSPQGHHNESKYGNGAPGQEPFSYENESAPAPRHYGHGAQHSPQTTNTISAPLKFKPRSPLDEEKSAVDLVREHSSNVRALRLLEVAAKEHGYTDDSGDEYGYVGGTYATYESNSIGKKLKLNKAKQQQAKEIRKMKKREFNTKAQMAESTREVKKAPRGIDPELTADKCQLDFDRQRASQKKALKLMGMF